MINKFWRRDSKFEKGLLSDKPVFVFAASWRTGSTLLQRIICSSNVIFLWGEPRFLPLVRNLYERMIDIQKLSESSGGEFRDFKPGSWIPTMFPGKDTVEESFRQFFHQLYYLPVTQHGYSRWGFKEVRRDAVPAAEFLHGLFPLARFIFLVRNPLDTYLSVKNMPFFAGFDDPMIPITNWCNNAAAFLEVTASRRLPAILVRHEDLVDSESTMRETIERICSHLEIPVTPRMLRECGFRVGASDPENPLTPEERQKIASLTSQTARRMGYELRG